MRILIIDDSSDFRALLHFQLKKSFPQSEIVDYDPIASGRPPDDFDWSRYSILLLDYRLGPAEDGLDWLKTYRRRPGFPPTVVLTAEGDEYVAVKAIRLGAAEYINKKDLTPGRLKDVIEEAATFTEEKVQQQQQEVSSAAHIVEQIREDREHKTGKDLSSGYRLVRRIGEGAMSQVYLAERNDDGLSVVLKVLDLEQAADSSLVQRFIQEAELVAGLNSPFVVRIYEHGLTPRYGFICMEFFPRGDLKQRMELKIVPEIAIAYMSYVAYGLDAIHGIGIVHRDLKPANIMFRGDDTLALADFGISKRIDNRSNLTTLGQVLGTPHYMSPEQGEGKDVDYRSDLYSAGVMFFELLAGHKPYLGNSPAAVIYQHVHSDLPELPEHLSRFQPFVNRAMAKDPAERYQTAREFIQMLEAAEKIA
jgi:DNA-binding response OmpR family regulator